MCNKCCDMRGYAPKIIKKSIGVLPTPWTPPAPDSPTGRLPAHTVLEETISPYTRDRTAKTPMSMEEFLELQEAANRIDDLYINNHVEYAKTILGEKRVEELLRERAEDEKILESLSSNPHTLWQQFLNWFK